jgi:hypothetical protein
MEELLFSRCKYEIRSAIDALEDAILKFRHGCCVPLSTRTIGPGCGAAGLAPRRLALLGFPARLLPVSLASQSLLSPQFLARLQIEGVTLYFLNHVFLLHLPLEAAKGVL